jgi:hypothetical protein
MSKLIPPCPNEHNHTEIPREIYHDDISVLNWFYEKRKTHKQSRCPSCRLWKIWTPIETDKFQYLVVLSHTFDDFPIKMFADRDEAFDHANSIPWTPPEEIVRVLELPTSHPCVISVWVFRNDVPAGRVIVREFDDNGDEDAEVSDPSPVVPESV